MKKLDFLSNSPRTFIFQKKSNKTTFGGFLAIIYILIILIIAFVYIYNYVANDKYIISYINYENPMLPQKITELGLDNDPNYNPTLNFSFDLVDTYGFSLSKNFLLTEYYTDKILERGKIYQHKVSDLHIQVSYKCYEMDWDCPIQPEDQGIYDMPFENFYLLVRYQISSLDLQNKEKPTTLRNDGFAISRYVINPDIMTSYIDEWQIIKIKEEKGILDNFFGKKNDSFSGTFFRNIFQYGKNKILKSTNITEYNYSKIVYEYKTSNTFGYYAEYSRKRVSVISLIANICSLSLTIFNGFRFVFNFLYSEKFSNYNVIDNILTSKRKPKQKIIENKFDKSSSLLSVNEVEDVEIEKKEEEETNKTDQTIEENEDSLPKYHIFSFIGNFFYCKRCKKNKIQANITMCNNIMEKYFSIENLIYNQFMLENLFRDYKWNNPNFNSIKNIELIYKLKEMIKTDGILL